MRPPMQLHKVRPGGNSMVPPEGVTRFFSSMLVHPAPAADSRACTIRTDDPSGAHCCMVRRRLVQQNPAALNSSHHRSPKKLHSRHFRTLHHNAMKVRAPHSQCLSVRKPRFHREISADKTNAAEAMAFDRRNVDSESLQRNDSVGHQTLAAWLVNRRSKAVGHHD